MRARFGPRFSLTLLAAVFLFVVVGLTLADQTIRDRDRATVSLQAIDAAMVVQSFIDVHGEALSSFEGVFASPDRAAGGRYFRELAAADARRLGGFERLWLTDSSGRVVHDFSLAGDSDATLATIDVDSSAWLGLDTLARQARATHRARLSRQGTLRAGVRGFVLLAPIYWHDRFTGFAAGTIPADSVLSAVARAMRREPGAIRLLIGADTAAPDAPAARGLTVATAPVRVPSDEHWSLQLAQHGTNGPRRVTLWLAGFAVLTALMGTLAHERRQAWRIAERSSELERLSSELLMANRSKSEFLANVSHELRTPLNAIVGFVELLREGVYGELAPRQVSPVERIEASANHLRHLVDQILDLAKMAAGRLEVHPEILDLRPFVLDVASEVESLLSEKSLNLSIGVGHTLPRVRTDPTHLRQILVNLIANAVKYTPAGSVSVRARLVAPGAGPSRADAASRPSLVALKPDAPWIALLVSDTGIGIAERDRERIFEEFEQVNAGPRGESMSRGTGLGLPISRRLARLLGGDITVESMVGKGSTFTLWLPVDPADVKKTQRIGASV
jgi:signal transduction histidine kinase